MNILREQADGCCNAAQDEVASQWSSAEERGGRSAYLVKKKISGMMAHSTVALMCDRPVALFMGDSSILPATTNGLGDG